jgi:hypothetical protein
LATVRDTGAPFEWRRRVIWLMVGIPSASGVKARHR